MARFYRSLEPEWLDELPPQDRRAVRSRADLRRINGIMGNVGLVARALAEALPPGESAHIADLGMLFDLAGPGQDGRLLVDAAVFGIVGIVLLIIGYYLWELITPYNVRKELQENKNVAVAVVVAAFIVGMAIVIAASLILIK